ncbi:MAG: urease accessory protein UreD [Nitrospira sp.]|nr:urease accessory protein UreD [Nitrospira sp.]
MSAASAAGWHGRLTLAFERRGTRTALAHSQAQMPLALQRAFYPEGEEVCHVLMLHPPGGMVGGDRLDITVTLGAQARALVTTPSAAKWYRATRTAAQQVTLRVAAGAQLEWLPLETIVFDGAIASQHLQAELEPGARLAVWDVVRFGRSAHGERFTRGRWRSAMEITRAGRPLWIDRQQLAGGSPLMRSAYGLADQPVAGTFAWLGDAAPDALIEAARGAWRDGAYPGEAGVTRLAEGLLCRYRGPSSAAARAWFTQIWDLLRRHAWTAPAMIPRIWST